MSPWGSKNRTYNEFQWKTGICMAHVNPMTNNVSRALWATKKDHDSSIYVVIDTARAPSIYPQVAGSKNRKASLLSGEQARKLAAVAPCLVQLGENDPLSQWLFSQGWGKSWCIFAESVAPFVEMRNHVRSFFRVTDHTGKQLFFRYYDPRVLREFFPTCDSQQLCNMFGPVRRYVLESETGRELMEYSVTNQFKLVQNVIQLQGS
jgi:hypothetical protein